MVPNPERFRLARQLNQPGIYLSIAHQPGTHKVFLGCSDFKVVEADLTDPKNDSKLALREIGKHESYVTSLALAGNTLISGSYDRKLIWWDLDARRQIRSVDAHDRWIRNVVISPDGRLAASVADDMVCKVWEVGTGRLVHTLRGHQEKTPNNFPSMLYAVTFSSNNRYLATGDKVGHIVIWDVNTGRELKTLEAPVMYTWDPRQRIHSIGGIRSLAFSPDTSRLAVGGMGQVGNIDHLEGKARLEVFDWNSGKRTHEFDRTKFKGLVNHLTFHSSGAWLLGAGGAGNGFFFFYELAGNRLLKEEQVPTHVHAVSVNSAFDTLYAACHQRIVVGEIK